jgi:ATP-binding cassette subfamily B (MDR/TAP) protein 1
VSLVILASVPVTVVGIAMISRRIQENTERHNNNLTQAVRLATYAITNIVIVKCFSTQSEEEENYVKVVKTAAMNSLKLGFSNALQSGFSRFISNAMFVQGQFEFRMVITTRGLIL